MNDTIGTFDRTQTKPVTKNNDLANELINNWHTIHKELTMNGQSINKQLTNEFIDQRKHFERH